jgi:hypoxanthine-guanine phosphoribosyltransferase
VRDSVPAADVATLRYVGVEIPGDWVVGYGLDAGQRWRNLPDVRRWEGGAGA